MFEEEERLADIENPLCLRFAAIVDEERVMR